VIILGGIDLFGRFDRRIQRRPARFLMAGPWFPLWLAVLVGIAGGTLAGYLNGLVIVYLGVPPLIVTLATLAIFRGLAYGISESRSFNGFPDAFAFWGSGEIAGLPFQLYLLVVVFVISSFNPWRHPDWPANLRDWE